MTFDFNKPHPQTRVEQIIRREEWDEFIEQLESRAIADRVARRMSSTIYHKGP